MAKGLIPQRLSVDVVEFGPIVNSVDGFSTLLSIHRPPKTDCLRGVRKKALSFYIGGWFSGSLLFHPPFLLPSFITLLKINLPYIFKRKTIRTAEMRTLSFLADLKNA